MSKKESKKHLFPQQIYVTIDKDGDWHYINAAKHPTELLGEDGEAELVGTYEFVTKDKMKLTQTVETL